MDLLLEVRNHSIVKSSSSRKVLVEGKRTGEMNWDCDQSKNG